MGTYRKIKIFYADDLSKNVRHLLEAVQLAGLIEPDLRLKLNLPDQKSHQDYNLLILQSEHCLVDLDYATEIDKAITKIKDAKGKYDLLICDLYFGENDEKYKDSKIGGIWPILWALHLSRERKVVCKLYSGQLAAVVDHIDFQKAHEFLEDAYRITVQQVGKSEDARSWLEYLQDYLTEVQVNIIPEIKLNDRVDVINYLSARLHLEHYENKAEDGILDAFRNDLLELGKMELKLVDGQLIKLIHLFPMNLGCHFISQDERNFARMDFKRIRKTLYQREAVYNSIEERDIELDRLQKENIDCEDFRNYDETGRPVYGIRFTKSNYDIGLISQIENSFLQSLDLTYQIHQFYYQSQGLREWSSSSALNPLGVEKFNRIRKEIIIPGFQRIRAGFQGEYFLILAEQIETAIKSVEEKCFWKKIDEQKLEHGFQKIKMEPIYNETTNDTLVPLQTLFRVNVPEFFRNVLHIKEGSDYAPYENEVFQRQRNKAFYWCCNAFAVREGLKDIVSILNREKIEYYLLESRENEGKSLVKYKIVLRDYSNGIPSIIRFLDRRKKEIGFVQLLKGFCELRMHTKLNGYEATAFDVYHGADERPFPKMVAPGVEFEIMFTQGRNR